ncbi:MAG: hypothetical protein DMG44_07215 [Acidobacteria bacterium]|nr:MAG: hypothetical protein DMG44_07215 [Acidobacteriota bacterium]
MYARVTNVKKKHAARITFVSATDGGRCRSHRHLFKEILEPRAFFWLSRSSASQSALTYITE